MDEIYSEQDGLKQDLGLTKVRAVQNQNYKRHGTKVSNIHGVLFFLIP